MRTRWPVGRASCTGGLWCGRQGPWAALELTSNCDLLSVRATSQVARATRAATTSVQRPHTQGSTGWLAADRCFAGGAAGRL